MKWCSIFLFCIIVHANTEIRDVIQSVSKSIVAVEVSLDGCREDYFVKGKCYGTGFFVASGLILTSQEVVQDKLYAKCIFFDRSESIAKVVAYDNSSSLVLLQAQRSDIPALKLKQTPQVGELVMTIGNPYKSISRVYQTAFSLGIVSGIYRFVRGNIIIENIVEIDAAVNPGNYGGPLVNIQGEVLGTIFSGYVDNRLLGLAIPTSHIENFIERYQNKQLPEPDDIFLLQNFAVYLGAVVIEKEAKVIVTKVEDESPAQESGIRKDDIILKVGDEIILTQERFKKIIQSYFVGQKIVLTIQRAEKIIEVSVVLRTAFM